MGKLHCFLLLSLLAISCGDRKEKAHDLIPAETPVPHVDVPETIIPDSSDDSTYFNIHIDDALIRVNYRGEEFRFTAWKQLDSLVVKKGGKKLDGKTAVYCDTKSSCKRIHGAIDVLKKNDVLILKLITPLEKEPGVK